MITIDVKIEDKFANVKKASDDAAFRNFGHAAAAIRRSATKSIRRGKRASEPGKPPRTRRGQLRRAIRFDGGENDAIVGPIASIAGESGSAHEFGGPYKGDVFDQRPFMRPALIDNLDRFAQSWAGSIGE